MAIKLTLAEQYLDCQTNETVLEALLRQDVDIPYSCRQGICHNCMMRSLDSTPPQAAQTGLREVLCQQKYFLACLCYPEQDMVVSIGAPADSFTSAIVTDKQWLNSQILQLTLITAKPLSFHAGQFVNLRRDDGLVRSYSIANRCDNPQKFIFHIRKLPGGVFSEWAHAELAVGDKLQISQPQGLCYYIPHDLQQNLLLIGTGSGLAPLLGIIEEALQNGHNGDIHLYHGSRFREELYLVNEMQQLASAYSHFHYTPCLSGELDVPGFATGRAHEVALANHANLQDWRLFLCGRPEMVTATKRLAYLKGASLHQIYADAFYTAGASQV